jgi:hypothetical protein
MWSDKLDQMMITLVPRMHLHTCVRLFFQSRDATITFQLTPAIYLSELNYVIKINSLPETRPKDVQKENGRYKTGNVTVSYGGKYFYYTNNTITHKLCYAKPR